MDNNSVNPLLASFIKLPGRVFKLPSGGYLYKNNELREGINEGELHVRPLGALSEIKLKSPDMLFSGQAVREVLGECVPEILQPLELFGRDIDALMVFLRVVTYGPIFKIDAKHGCEKDENEEDGIKAHQYDIDLEGIINDIRELDPTTVGSNYTVEMENGQNVIFDPVRFKHIIELLQSNNKDLPTAEDIQQNLIKNLLNMINNIDGISDKKQIEEWIKAVPAPYITKIANALEASNEWGPKFERQVKCRGCGEMITVELPLNPVNFFSG